MRKTIIAVLFCVMPGLAFAAGAKLHLDKANIDLANTASLQRGARLFVNYCLSCHSASFMRYNRMGKDLGLSEQQVTDNLMFASDKIGETMAVAMRPADATAMFGTAVPDLTVIARARGVDWLYTYLRGFYLDPTRPFGVNNLVFKDVGMPHVLWDLQGWQAPVYKTVTNHEGKEEKVIEKLEIVKAGTMSPEEYNRAVRDLVNYLAYMGEPAKLERQRLGVWVLMFLAIFTVIAYMLKKEYWKDVH